MTQQRINNLALPHVHKDIVDSLKLENVANDFVGDLKHRLNFLGRF